MRQWHCDINAGTAVGSPAVLPRLAWRSTLATLPDSQFVLAIALVALIIHVVSVLLIRPEPVSDFAWYFHEGAAISEGHGYVTDEGVPTAFWPVGYPAFLAVTFRFFGTSALTGEFANAGLSVATVVLFYC